jgi:hypothetical protein
LYDTADYVWMLLHHQVGIGIGGHYCPIARHLQNRGEFAGGQGYVRCNRSKFQCRLVPTVAICSLGMACHSLVCVFACTQISGQCNSASWFASLTNSVTSGSEPKRITTRSWRMFAAMLMCKCKNQTGAILLSIWFLKELLPGSYGPHLSMFRMSV